MGALEFNTGGVDVGCLRVFASDVRDVKKEGASCFISCCITNISRKLRGDNEIETFLLLSHHHFHS